MFGEILIPPPPKWMLPPTMVPSGNYGLQMRVCPPGREGGGCKWRVARQKSNEANCREIIRENPTCSCESYAKNAAPLVTPLVGYQYPSSQLSMESVSRPRTIQYRRNGHLLRSHSRSSSPRLIKGESKIEGFPAFTFSSSCL